MKKITLLLLVTLVTGTCVYAQDKMMQIYKNDVIVRSIDVSQIDSIKFGEQSDVDLLVAASTNTWTITSADNTIQQEWSDYLQYDGDNKVDAGTIEDYAGTNTVGDYRNNPGYRGFMYNLPYIQANENKLCPSPWRVPSPEDIINLDKALGGDGTNYHLTPGTLGAGHDPNIGVRVQRYINELDWEFSGRVNANNTITNAGNPGGIGNLSTNAAASETIQKNVGTFESPVYEPSNVQNEVNTGPWQDRPSHLCVKVESTPDGDAVFPQNEGNSSNQKERAFPVRCVK